MFHPTPRARTAARPRLLVVGLVVVGLIASVVAGPITWSGEASAAGLTPQFEGAPWFRPGYVYDQNFPDPDVVYDAGTDTYYAFATTTGGVNLPIMTSSDLITWTARDDHSIENTASGWNDGLPFPAPAGLTWSTGDPAFPHPIWAPGVGRIGGRWVVFYALQIDASGRRCIAYATASVPEGPYLDPKWMLCSDDPMGSIDPKPFTDPATGTTYLLWKDQGYPNRYGQRSWARAITMTNSTTVAWAAGSSPTMLFESSGSWEVHSAENPSLMRMDDGGLALFWSGGEWDSAGYGVGYARCPELRPSSSPVCVRTSEAPVMSRRQGEVGIGGSSAFRDRDGQLRIANHFWAEGLPTDYPNNQRFLVIDRVDVLGGRVIMSHEPGPTTASVAAGYAPIGPTRVLDTRSAVGTTARRRTEAGEVFVVDASGVTSANAVGVTVNLTVVSPLGDGFVTVYECGEPPVASNLNHTVGVIVPDLATVRLNDARHFCVLTSASTHLVVDVEGEWIASGAGRVSSVDPARLLDTRVDGGRPAAGGQVEVQVAGRANVPAGASAAVVALTSANSSAGGFLTAWDCDGPRPTASNVNHGAGVPSTNTAIVPLSARGSLCVSTLVANDVIVDVLGAVTDAGGRLTVDRPARMVDTRDGGTMVGAADTLRVPVSAGGTMAASIVITAVDPIGPSWVAVFACDAAPARGSETSVLNVVGGEIRAAHVIAPLDATGAVCLRPLVPMHLIVDRSGTLA